jgi:hypothetical protein
MTAGYTYNFEKSDYEKQPIEYPSKIINGVTPRPLAVDNLLGE